MKTVIYRKRFLRIRLKPASLKATSGTFNLNYSVNLYRIEYFFPEFF